MNFTHPLAREILIRGGITAVLIIVPCLIIIRPIVNRCTTRLGPRRVSASNARYASLGKLNEGYKKRKAIKLAIRQAQYDQQVKEELEQASKLSEPSTVGETSGQSVQEKVGTGGDESQMPNVESHKIASSSMQPNGNDQKSMDMETELPSDQEEDSEEITEVATPSHQGTDTIEATEDDNATTDSLPGNPDLPTDKKNNQDDNHESTPANHEDNVTLANNQPSSPNSGLLIPDSPKDSPDNEPTLPESVSGASHSSDFDQQKLHKQIESIKYAALTYKERGKLDKYEKKLVEGLSLDQDNNEFMNMLADHYFTGANHVKALTLLKKIIAHQPENHKAIWQTGRIYQLQQKPEAAEMLVDKALQQKPDHPKYLISLVEIYYDKRELRKSLEVMERLRKLRPTNIDYLLTIGTLHEELNEPTFAKNIYMKILELNPQNEHAKAALKKL